MGGGRRSQRGEEWGGGSADWQVSHDYMTTTCRSVDGIILSSVFEGHWLNPIFQISKLPWLYRKRFSARGFFSQQPITWSLISVREEGDICIGCSQNSFSRYVRRLLNIHLKWTASTYWNHCIQSQKSSFQLRVLSENLQVFRRKLKTKER